MCPAVYSRQGLPLAILLTSNFELVSMKQTEDLVKMSPCGRMITGEEDRLWNAHTGYQLEEKMIKH